MGVRPRAFLSHIAVFLSGIFIALLVSNTANLIANNNNNSNNDYHYNALFHHRGEDIKRRIILRMMMVPNGLRL